MRMSLCSKSYKEKDTVVYKKTHWYYGIEMTFEMFFRGMIQHWVGQPNNEN